jgi:NADPH2:quinone reductase
MPLAVEMERPGGPEVLTVREIPLAQPGKEEVLLRHTAIGLNYIDTYHRSGLYALPSYPAILGMEACGVVEKCGPGVTRFKPGDRVAYAHGPTGAYAQYRTLHHHYLVKVPPGLDDRTVAAIMVKGLTAHYLLRSTYVVQSADKILVHAAAGGVGLLLCQWAKHLGAYVIGTVGSQEKAELARAHGCEEVILYKQENFVARVKEITQGRGVAAVYDSVGRDTFMDSLDCLRPLGMMVLYGQSSGPVPALDPNVLARKGSLYLTRPSLMHHLESLERYIAASEELFTLVQQGVLKVHIGQTFPLAQAAEAHRKLEERKTVGATLLLP